MLSLLPFCETHRYTNESAAGLQQLAAALSFDSVTLALQARFPTLLRTVCTTRTTHFSAFTYSRLSDLFVVFFLLPSVCLKSIVTLEERFHSAVDDATFIWLCSPCLFMKFGVFADGLID